MAPKSSAAQSIYNYNYGNPIGDLSKLDGKTLMGVDVLQDATPNDIAALNGKQTNVVLDGRTLWTDGAWNTLCLPFPLGNASAADGHHFDGTPLEGFTVMELDTETAYGGHLTGLDGSTLYLNFKDATSITAGRPYIVRKDGTGGIANPLFTGITVRAASPAAVGSTDGAVSFTGSYSPVTLAANDQSNLYLGTASTLYWPTDVMTIGACRAYFHVDLTCPVNAIRTFRLSFGDEETGIVSTTRFVEDPLTAKGGNYTNCTNGAGAWHTIDGIHLDGKPTKKGLYIHGGRKVAIK